jgi:hypothetical protein
LFFLIDPEARKSADHQDVADVGEVRHLTPLFLNLAVAKKRSKREMSVLGGFPGSRH